MTAGAVGVRGFAGKQRMPYAALREGTQFYRDIYIHVIHKICFSVLSATALIQFQHSHLNVFK